MQKIIYFSVIFTLIFTTATFAQSQASNEPAAVNIIKTNPEIISKDTIIDPVDLQSGEIMGLENADREIKPEGTKEKKKADELYRDLGFEASSEVYKSLSKKEKKSEKVLARIANSHRLNNNTEDAEYWYAKFITEEKEAKHLLHYAQVLQSNGKCEDALRWYESYTKVADKKDLENRAFIVDCQQDAVTVHKNVTVENVSELNTKHLDFSPVPHGNGIVFTTTRNRNKVGENKDNWTNDNFTDLFYAELNNSGKFSKPVPFIGEVNGKYHDGTASFNSGESVMVFTRNNTNGKSKNDLIDLKIYSANKGEDGYWADIDELPFNSNEYSTCHPTLTDNGDKLYFSSNRPDGYGGMDIYVCFAQDGEWSEPQNLGPTVNSSGNEIFPFIAQNGALYYSSNGHSGLGGLDIYKATKSNTEDEGSWIFRENIGEPYNSKKDDFGFYINEEETMGYLSSSRRGGNGKDDIYSWKFTEGSDDVVSRQICVFEEGTENRIAKANVTMIERVGEAGDKDDMFLTLKPVNQDKDEYLISITSTGNDMDVEIENFQTDENGLFTYTAFKRNRVYEILIEKEGFLTEKKLVSGKDLWTNESYCIPLKVNNCLSFSGLVKNKQYNMPMAGAQVRIYDKCNNEEQKILTNEDGTFDACLKCGCEYGISASKGGFDGDYEFISTLEMDCKNKERVSSVLELKLKSTPEITQTTTSGNPTSYNSTNRNPRNANGYNPSQGNPYNPNAYNGGTNIQSSAVPLVPIVTYQAVTTYQPVTSYQPITTYVPADQLTGHHLDAYLAGDPSVKLSEGSLIRLNEVFYDFNKFNIRADASTDLDHVVRLMMAYPSMIISMRSHTDARGTDAYNMTLSQNRADAARKYLISKGVASHRVSARGFGETMLRNHCKNGVKCADAVHEENRRTEIQITKFNEPNVKPK